MILFQVSTHFQLICALIVKLQLCGEEKADLHLDDNQDFSGIIENLTKMGIFEHIEISRQFETFKEFKSTLRLGEKVSEIPDLWGFSHDTNYTDIYFGHDMFPNKMYYYYLVNKNYCPKIHILDEGMPTYFKDLREASKGIYDPCNHVKFGEKNYIDNIVEQLLFLPECYCVSNSSWKITRIPKITQNVKNQILEIYDNPEIEIPDEKYIYFAVGGYADNFFSNETDLIKNFADIVGKENIIIKKHPGYKEDIYSKFGYKVWENEKVIPWEILLMSGDFSDKVFVSIFSNATISGFSFVNYPQKIIFLYNFYMGNDRYGMFGKNAKQSFQWLKLLKSYLNRNIKQIYTPQTLNQLREDILYLEGIEKMKSNTNITPFFSVIISSYNSESTLSRCLESLVYQSFGNIEILVVDKESTDDSCKIAEMYQENFSDKVKLYRRPYSINLSAAYNFAIPLARGEYLVFADADDWYELNAMEILYNHLDLNQSDIVNYEFRVLDQSGKTIRIGKHSHDLSIKGQLIDREMNAYWSRAYKKNMFVKHLPIPEVPGPDANFLPVLITNARIITKIARPLYNYAAGIGTTSVRVSGEWLSLIDGWEYLLENVKGNYTEFISYYISMRLELAIKKYWLFKYEYIKWAKEKASLFLENDFIKKQDPKKYDFLKNIIEEDYRIIPPIIYINGFGRVDAEKRKKEIYDSIPRFEECGGDVVILNNDNCDVYEIPQTENAFREGEFEYLGHYFALKNIYNTGGFYAGDHIKFTATLEGVQGIAPAVFSYLTPTTCSDEIFGAVAENPVIRKLLKTYQVEDFYRDVYYPLKLRIANVMVANYDVVLDGRPQFIGKIAYIADPQKFVRNVSNSPYACEHDFSDYFGEDGYRVVPDELYIVTRPKVIDTKVVNRAVDKKSTDELELKRQIENLRKRCRLLEQHIKNDESSEAWKIGLAISKFANSSVCRPLKAIYMLFKDNREGEA